MSTNKKIVKKENVKKGNSQNITIILIALAVVLVIGIVCGSIIINKITDKDDGRSTGSSIVDDLPENFKN